MQRLILLLALLTTPAMAQDHSPLHKDFYHKWTRPDVGGSCCNARLASPFGGQTGDCEPTETKVLKGDWYARLPLGSRHLGDADGFIKIPDSKIIHEPNPNTLDGHMCWTRLNGVMCFNPPNTGF